MKLHQALALVLLAGPASAQLQSTATARLGPILDQAEPLFARSHPSGGAVACYRTDAFGSGTATVPLVRVDDSGQELWRHELAVQAGPGPLDSLNVSPSGDIFLCTQDEGVLLTPPEGRIHAFDADGAALWSTWPEGRTGGLFQGRVAGFSPSGDLFVMGIDRETGTFTTLLLDDATGDELWRVDAAGASGNLFVGLLRTTTVEGDAIALVQSGFASFAVRVDPSGQIVHDTTVPGFTGLDEVVRTITPASGGETVVTFWDESSTATVVRLDATGTIRWQASVPNSGNVMGVARAANGDAVVAFRRNGGLIRRFDENGASAWTRPGPANTRWLTGIVAASDGAFEVVARTGVAPSFDGVAVARYRSDGAPESVFELAPTGPNLASAKVASAVLSGPDDRGNTWCTYITGDPMFLDPIDAAATRLVVDHVVEDVTCVQGTPNSTAERGRLSAIGSAAASENDLTLVADRLPVGQTVLFLGGRSSGFLANPGGSAGDLCLGFPFARYSADLRTSDAAGRAVLALLLPFTPEGIGTVPILAGETWFWQAWHREPASGSHLTSAVSVTFD